MYVIIVEKRGFLFYKLFIIFFKLYKHEEYNIKTICFPKRDLFYIVFNFTTLIYTLLFQVWYWSLKVKTSSKMKHRARSRSHESFENERTYINALFENAYTIGYSVHISPIIFGACSS